MRMGVLLAGVLLFSGSAFGLDLGKELNAAKNKSLLENVNQQLAQQQNKDGQFEFKSGKAEFAPGNEKRINGLLKVISDNSADLKKVFPKLHIVAQGHTDATGSAPANQKLSQQRAEIVCKALKQKGMSLGCVAKGFGSSKPLVKPEKSEADKQRNRRVLVQMAD